MKVYHKQVNLFLGETQLQFNYSYNNYTTYENLLEYVCLLFPDYKFCPCYHFSNSNNFINNDVCLAETNDINNNLKISNINNDYKCHCSKEIKDYFKKNKMTIIELYEKENENLKKQNEELNKKINDLQFINLNKEKELENIIEN